MSSTSNPGGKDGKGDRERLAHEFWEENLLALARRTAGGGSAPYFALAPDPALPTYFIRRTKTRWTATDFEAQSTQSPRELGAALAQFWQAAGNPELARLAPRFAELAERVYDVDTQTGEVTPFMYVMF